MAHRLTWSPAAAEHLAGICEYIARDSEMYAIIFARRVVALVETIPRNPLAGRIVPEYSDRNLRERILGNCRIVYRVRRSEIEVAAICHCARLITRVLEP